MTQSGITELQDGGWSLEKLSAPPLNLQGWERGWRLNSITQNQWFNQLPLHNKTLIKTLNIVAQGSSLVGGRIDMVGGGIHREHEERTWKLCMAPTLTLDLAYSCLPFGCF